MKIVGNTIHINRGDIGSISVSAKTDSGEPFAFSKGDVVRLQVMTAKNCNDIKIKKVINVTEETTESVTFMLSSEETKIGNVISKPVVYWYEIEINPDSAPITIIGYDNDGAKEFILYPEGVDVNV